MAIKTLTCSRCGGKIPAGLNYSYNGKSLCYNCYQEVQKEILVTEEERKKLFDYIKQLFSLTEIPSLLIININKEVGKGKTYEEIRYTLYYYYKILENPCGSVDVIPFVLRDNYESAQTYKEEVQRTKEINQKITISNKVRVIQIPHSELKKGNARKKKIYDITDL